MRYYNPASGRWLGRDPIGELGFTLLGGGSQTAVGAGLEDSSDANSTEAQGGENLYGFVGNDPILLSDFLGLRWKVDRKGGAKAPAESEAGDTVAQLAASIGLNAADYEKWLTPVAGTAMPSSSSQPLTACEKFEIPNTVVAYWAGNLGGFGQWWVRWNSSIAYLQDRGFSVGDVRHQTGNRWGLQSLLTSRAAVKDLHGLYFWGHGTAPYPAQFLVSDSGDVLLEFASINLNYKVALALMFACDSNSGQRALSSGTSGNIWKGFSGTLVPWPFRHYHARHFIHPGQQETH